jgi:hypothetical protein
VNLIIGVVFFVTIFVVAALLTRILNKDDLDSLRAMASGLGILGKIVDRILNLIEKVMDLLKYN